MNRNSLFREVPRGSSQELIRLDSKIFALGSCFAEHMTARLVENRVQLCLNPTGTLYNPLSISQLLQRLVAKEWVTNDEIFPVDGGFGSFMSHTLLNRESGTEYVETLNQILEEARSSLLSADIVLVTLGTAQVWRHKKSAQVVANCQKQPGTLFDRELLSEVEVHQALQDILTSIGSVNPSARVICTVSPVRYEKGNPFLNSVSKGRLFSALHHFVAGGKVLYFPAYEILIDELRDYRFYSEDMAHPSTLATRIIWDRFSGEYCHPTLLEWIDRYAPVLQAKGHRSQQVSTKWITKMEHLLNSLESTFGIDLSVDRKYFQNMM